MIQDSLECSGTKFIILKMLLWLSYASVYLHFTFILEFTENRHAEYQATHRSAFLQCLITSTPYAVLPLFATRFAACTGGIRVTFIEPYLI